MSSSFPSGALFRFGVVADPQYAAIEPNLELNRYPALSLGKLAEAIDEFNRHELAFVVTLGDIVDRLWESFDAVLAAYGRLRHPAHFLLGNHDFAIDERHLGAVIDRVGMPSAYYDFAFGGYRFVMLDGNEVSLFAPAPGDPRRDEATRWLTRLEEAGAGNAQRWNAAIGTGQLAWLEGVIDQAASAGEKVVLMNHYPVFPENEHNLWNADAVLGLIAGRDHVVAYFNGHNHAGNFGVVGATSFVNFHGMVDTSDSNAYAVVTVYRDRMEIAGFGRETSRTLHFSA